MDKLRGMLTLAAFVAVVGGCWTGQSEPPGSPTRPTDSPTVSPAALPSITASATPGADWVAVELPASATDAPPRGLMEAVAAGDLGLAAVGSTVCSPDDEPTDCHVSIWTRTGSDAWARTDDQPALRVAEGGYPHDPPGLFDVTSGPAGVVAIGHPADPAINGAWQSLDGRTWTRSPFDFGAANLTAIAGGPFGYVVVGWVHRGLAARAAAWFSSDGLTWKRARDSAAMDVGGCIATLERPGCGGMQAVAAAATGFVAVGEVRSKEGRTGHPAAWTSTDGLSWTRADAGLGFDGRLSGIAAGSPGVVAVGTRCRSDCVDLPHDGLIATSADGSTWDLYTLPTTAELSGVAGAGRLTVALGEVANADGSGTWLEIWVSEDGLVWRPMPGPPPIPETADVRAVDLVVAPDGAVTIVGWVQTTDERFQNFSFTRS